MSIKAGILGFSDAATRSSNLGLWTMAGLGITVGLYSHHKLVKYYTGKLSVFAREEKDNGIERLPDDILCDIVSLLPIDVAARTSILSRRWRKIWTMHPELTFFCTLTFDRSKVGHYHVVYSDRQRFLKGVDQCLQLYSGRHLETFCLHCCFLNSHTSQLVRWMQALARLDVKEISLGNSCRTCDGDLLDKPFTFSFRLIDGFSSLKYLDLMACRVETSFASYCNSLLTLRLRYIRLSSHQLSDILMFCPNLKSLQIRQSELPESITISGPNLNLRTLKLYACNNVQKVEISDINILIINIDIRSEVQVLLSSVPKLEKLHLRTSVINYCLKDAPRQMPQLKELLLQPKFQILGLPPTFQVFGNIRILRILTRGYPYREACVEVDLWNFAPALVACPLLKEFYLMVGGPACKKERKGQWPVLRHQHLERMELSGFYGTGNELEFAKFIAMSAQVLQTFVLRLSCSGCKLAYSGFDIYEEVLYFEDVKGKDSKWIDSDEICAGLREVCVSEHATLKVEL